jgi:hypothetical protein
VLIIDQIIKKNLNMTNQQYYFLNIIIIKNYYMM